MSNANRMWSTYPTVVCPNCEHEWTPQNYTLLEVDSSLDCPKCGVRLQVVDKSRIWRWQWERIDTGEGGELVTGPTDAVGNFSVSYKERLK